MSGFGDAVQGRRWSAETTVDQALIRGLGTAFRVCVSGLSTFLESGRRAEPGHITSDGGSPPWPHPRRCAAGCDCADQGLQNLSHRDGKFLLASVAAVTARRVDRLQFVEVEPGAGHRRRRLGLEGGEHVGLQPTGLTRGARLARSGGEADQAPGATWPAIAHRKAAISRAMAAITTGSFLPVALSRR